MFRRKITRPLPVRTLATLGTFVVMPDAPTTPAVPDVDVHVWDNVRDVAKHNR